MKSTGEVLGIAKNFEDALYKGLIAAGYNMEIRKGGGVLITVRDSDKKEILYVAEKFARLGFCIYATSGTAAYLNKNGIKAEAVRRVSEDAPNIMDLLDSGKIDYVISTSSHGRTPQRDSVRIRRKTVERSICCLTAIDTANAVADILAMDECIDNIDQVNICEI